MDWKITDEMLEALREAVENEMADEAWPCRSNEHGRITRLDNIVGRDPIFREVLTSDMILDPLESLLGPNIELTLNRHNHATINMRGDTMERLHRDILQWSRSIVTAIIYLDESTHENGCTHIIPGSHYLPFVGTPNNGGTWMDEHSVYFDLIQQSLPIPMPRGGILFFDGLAFHTVGENKTDFTRMSIAAGYRSIDELQNPAANDTCLLVRGERLYRGNDLYYRSSSPSPLSDRAA